MVDSPGWSIPGSAHVGRVGLRVQSLTETLPFYREVIGLSVELEGDRAILGVSSPLIVLSEDPGATARDRTEAGLFHVAVRVPTRAALADALSRIQGSEFSLTGASNHLVSEALYLRDPEGNGVEIYRDRRRAAWSTTDDGMVDMQTLPLDLDSLATDGMDREEAPAGTDIGHVHLEVTDLARAEAFYVDTLGFGVRARYGSDASFLAAGDYHHHIGLNTWNHREARRSNESCGLDWVEFVLPEGFPQLRARLRQEAQPVQQNDEAISTLDPDGISLRFLPESSARE